VIASESDEFNASLSLSSDSRPAPPPPPRAPPAAAAAAPPPERLLCVPLGLCAALVPEPFGRAASRRLALGDGGAPAAAADADKITGTGDHGPPLPLPLRGDMSTGVAGGGSRFDAEAEAAAEEEVVAREDGRTGVWVCLK
jgi:hypothetical protein